MGALQGGFNFFDLRLCYLLFDFSVKGFVKKFDFPEFHMLNLDFIDFPG